MRRTQQAASLMPETPGGASGNVKHPLGQSPRGCFLPSSYSVLRNGGYFFTFLQKFIRIVATCWRAALPCGSR